MLNVMDLLAFAQFNDFKLVTNSKGLFNPVLGTGLWEWETPDIIEKTFSTGEFVFTVLSAMKNDKEVAYDGLRTLIKKKVSAIAIKTVYFDKCPDEIVELANKYGVPIFIFSDSYIDDLVYVVKNAVISNDSNNVMLTHLRELISDKSGADVTSYAKKLNPLLFDNSICMCCLCQGPDATEKLETALMNYRKAISLNNTSDDTRHSLIKCNNSIVIIYTAEKRDVLHECREDGVSFASRLVANIDEFHVGISMVKKSLSEVKNAIDESIIAALSAVLENDSYRKYEEIGADAFLLANIENKHFIEFYDKTYKCLTTYDDTHRSDLLKTLMCYVESEGDISLTSRKLYQHNNTIRYRLDKIKKLLNITNSFDTELQFYVFARMHKLELDQLLYKELII